MKFEPRPYQTLIIEHILKTPRCAVWAGMGTGKTVSTLTAIQQLIAFGDCRCALVIAPLRVARSSWMDESEKWDHLSALRVRTFCGSPRQKYDLLSRLEIWEEAKEPWCHVATINYELLPWLVGRLGDAWPFDIIVADEATRLKSFRVGQGGVRAKALSKVMPSVKRFIELTGTPAPNGLEDLWGQFWFLDKGKRLGRSMTAYHQTYFRSIRVGAQPYAVRWELMPGCDAEIHKAVSDLVVKVNAEDWFDLEEPIFSTIEVELPDKAHDAYRKMEKAFFVEIGDGRITAPNAAVKASKCLQIASGFIYDEDGSESFSEIHDEKIAALRSVLEEAGGMPVLVAYQWKADRERILKAFPKARVLDKDPQTIRDWNAGKIPLLLAHPASCGHGLSLQDGGNILVFFSTGWSLEEHAQIIERIGPTRQAQSGHKRPVFVYSIVAKDTMDETVQERIQTKKEVLDLLLERRARESES